MKKKLFKLSKRVLSVILVIAILNASGVIAPIRASAAPANAATVIENGGIYMLRLVENSEYMDAGDALRRNTGVRPLNERAWSVTTRPFNGSDTQLWRVASVSGGYQIWSVGHPDRLLSCQNNVYGSGTLITNRVGASSVTNAQRFAIERQSDGSYQIETTRWMPLTSDYCIGYNGSETVQRGIRDSDDRKWYFIEPGRVTYNARANGGSEANRRVDCFEGATINLSTTAYPASKADAIFLGWNTDQTAKTALTSLKMGSENITLYAIFKDKQPVTYNAIYNGGTNVGASTASIYPGDPVDLTGPKATKANADFLGWSKTFNGPVETSLIMPDGPLTLYAIFKNKLQLIYHPNGGAALANPTAWYFENDNVDLSPRTTLTDARQLGWNIGSNDTTTLTSFRMPGQNTTLFAIYQYKQTVTYNYTFNGGTQPAGQLASAKFFEGETITPLPTATKTDARHLGWNTDRAAKAGQTNIKMNAAGLTLYAIYEDKIQVTYSFTSNGGKSVSKASDKFFAGDLIDLSPTAAKDDARFLGWHTNAASKTPLTSLNMPTTPLTLHAIFEDKIQVTYNYAYNGGASVSKSTDKFYKGDPVSLNVTASKPGWAFLGWHTNQNATVPLTSLTMPDSALTLYAIYRLTTPVKFVDYDDSGRVERTVNVITYNRDVPAPSTHTITVPVQNTPSDWTHLGWTHLQTAGSPAVISPVGGTAPFQSAYYGLYSHDVTLSYDADGGNFTPPPSTALKYLNSFNLDAPLNPVFSLAFGSKKPGYSFTGWRDSLNNLHPQGSNAAFGADTILTAAWNEIRVDGVALSCYNLVIGVGETAGIQAFVLPGDAANRGVTWSSNDPAIATVDQNGNVTAIADGIAIVTATSQDGGKTAECEVTVSTVAVPVSQVTLSVDDVAIFVGGEKQLTCALFPGNASNSSVTWSSSNPDVATVDETGLVKGHSVGEAVITIQSVQGGKSSTCTVTVNPIAVTGISLSEPDLLMRVGGTEKLIATISPGSATDRRIAWDSSDTLIATVDEDGNVTAHNLGEAVITVRTADGNKTASCTVTVEPVRVTGIALSDSTVTIRVWDTKQLAATITPANATDQNVIWSSSDSSIADVNGYGLVTALRVGQATITATAVDGGEQARCIVKVEPIRVTEIQLPAEMKLFPGDVKLLQAEVLPENATDKTLTWQSANETIASVDEVGRVTGHKPGNVKISATSADGNVVGACDVTVEPIRVTGIQVSDSKISILNGSTAFLNAKVSPDNATDQSYTWSTSDATIATVRQGGEVSARKVGKVTITATSTDGAKKASCEVTVLPVAVERVALLNASVSIPTGGVKALTATISPANATNKSVTWSSSDTSIATMDQDGKVTGVKNGTAVITVTTVDGGKTAQCTVTVEPVRVTKVKLSKSSVIIPISGIDHLIATIEPVNATDKRVTWASSDASVAAIDENGTITALKEGRAMITVTASDGGLQAYCNVWVRPVLVSSITLSSKIVKAGDTLFMVSEIFPAEATDKSLTWFSSNTAIATVDHNGILKGVAAGKADIIAVSNDAGGVRGTATVTVQGEEKSMWEKAKETWNGIKEVAALVNGPLNSIHNWIGEYPLNWAVALLKLGVSIFTIAKPSYDSIPQGNDWKWLADLGMISLVFFSIAPIVIVGIPWLVTGGFALLTGLISGGKIPSGTTSWMDGIDAECNCDPNNIEEWENCDCDTKVVGGEGTVGASSFVTASGVGIDQPTGIRRIYKNIEHLNIVKNSTSTKLTARFDDKGSSTSDVAFWVSGGNKFTEANRTNPPVALFGDNYRSTITVTSNSEVGVGYGAIGVGLARLTGGGQYQAPKMEDKGVKVISMAVYEKLQSRSVVVKNNNTNLRRIPSETNPPAYVQTKNIKWNTTDGRLSIIGQSGNYYLVDTHRNRDTGEKWMYVLKNQVEDWVPEPLTFVWPAPGYGRRSDAPNGTIGNFGWRVDPVSGSEDFHKGFDINERKDLTKPASISGQPAVAFADGYVYDVGVDLNSKGEVKGRGYYVTLRHEIKGKTYYSIYMHLFKDGRIDRYDKDGKDRLVKAGDIIGKIGSTGKSTGAHLHFEFMRTYDWNGTNAINTIYQFSDEDTRHKGAKDKNGKLTEIKNGNPLFILDESNANYLRPNESFNWDYKEGTDFPAYYSHDKKYKNF